jgi:CRP/FNR family cyclic AMP-dependent transcriptional regulator
MNAAELLELVAALPLIELADGEVLITDGEPSPGLFVIIDGVLEVERHGHHLARLDTPGAVVGEMAVLLGTAATASVVARGSAVVRRVDDAERLFRDHPDFARYVAEVLARRLHRVSSLLDDLQEQFAGTPGTLGLVPGVIQDLLGSGRDDFDMGSDREVDSPY